MYIYIYNGWGGLPLDTLNCNLIAISYLSIYMCVQREREIYIDLFLSLDIYIYVDGYK